MKKRTKVIIGILLCAFIILGAAGAWVYYHFFSLAGLHLDELTTDLTSEQQLNPISKYYHETPAQPAQNILDALEEPLTESQMFYPEQMDYFLDPANEIINGYGVLENGVAYSVTETVMEGVSEEMYGFYEAWSNAQNDRELIYKIWYPGYHYTQTVTMTIVEDIGQGMEVIRFMNGKASYSSELVQKYDLDMYVINATITPADGGDGMKSILLHVKFEDENGNYVDRCVTWFGCYWKNGKIVVDLTGLDDAVSRAKGMAYHSAGENANLAAVIMEVYAAEKDNFDFSQADTGRTGKGHK